MQHERRVSLDRYGGVTVRIGRTPVTLNWTFLLLAGFYILALGRPWQYGLMFAGVALVGILWHEAGHAVAFRLVGRRSRIVIHGIGGVTISDDQRDLRDAEGAGVALAGPLLGIVVGLIALWLQLHDVGAHALWSRVLVSDIIFVNLGWGLLNLLPVVPLDGGQVVERLVGQIAPRHRHTVPYLISIGVSLVGLIVAWRGGYPLGVAFAGAFALINLRWFSDHRRIARRERADTAALGALRQAAVTPLAAEEELRAALGSPLSAPVWIEVATTLAWMAAWRLAPGDQQTLAALCQRLAGHADTGLLAAVDAHARGQRREATLLLARGFSAESTPPPDWLVTRLLADRLAVDALADAIDGLALGERHQGFSRLITVLEQAGRVSDAATIRERMARPVVGDGFPRAGVSATATPSR